MHADSLTNRVYVTQRNISLEGRAHPSDYYAKSEYRIVPLSPDVPEEKQNELKVTTLKLPSKVIVRSGSTTTVYGSITDEDRVEYHIREFKQKIQKQIEQQQGTIVLLQNRVNELEAKLQEKEEILRTLEIQHRNQQALAQVSHREPYPELEYLKTQCKEINRKLKVVVKECEKFSPLNFKSLEQRVNTVLEGMTQIACIRVNKLKKSSQNIEKFIQALQSSVREFNTQQEPSHSKFEEYQQKLEYYNHTTHRFLNLVYKLQNYPAQLSELSSRVQSLEFLARSSQPLKSPRSVAGTAKKQSNNRIEELRNTLIKMRGSQGQTKVKVDSQGYLKFFDSDTYIFDGDGSFFRISQDHLNSLTSSILRVERNS